ncbi:putative ABC transporter permease subunit [Oceanithermus profundus]
MLRLRLRILRHSLAARPLAVLVAAALGLGVAALAYVGTLAFLRFLSGYPFAARVVEVRSLEGLFLVLSAAVLLSALPGALAVLYDSRDLPLLLAWPLPAARVFTLKVIETYAVTALVPTLLTLPVLYALGAFHEAPFGYHLVATLAVLALYALPVGLGVGLALPLVRFAPAGRAREWAGALSAVLGGAMIYGLRALRPEALFRQEFANEAALKAFIQQFQNPAAPFLPPAWAGRAVQEALAQPAALSPALLGLLLTAAAVLGASALAAGYAYQAGWVRGLEGASVLRPARPPAVWERALARLGGVGALWVRDLRLFLRDPNQIAQLVLVAVLVLLYTTSLAAMPLEGAVFVRVVGFLHLAFQGLVIAGVGVRLAYPLYSFEGPGYWLVQTAPVGRLGLLLSRYALALLLLLPLGLALGLYAPSVIGLDPGLRTVSLISALAAVVGLAALGVGLGAVWPNREATNASEVPMSLGGMLYMLVGTLFAFAIAALDARPVYWALGGRADYLSGPEGALWLAAVILLTLAVALASLGLAYAKGR